MSVTNRKKIANAKNLKKKFSGHDAKVIGTITIPDVDTVAVIGYCTGIMYNAIRDGVEEDYLHQFKAESQPLLCITEDGQQLLLLDGSYLFTERGIEDV